MGIEARFMRTLAIAALLVPFAVAAQTVYKLIDRNGKTTYSETPPKNFDGQVIRLDIDPNANSASLNVPKSDLGAPAARQRKAELKAEREAGTKSSHMTKLEEARAQVEAAQKAFDDAHDNPGPDDFRFLGKVGGGSRPVPTEEYQARLANTEKSLQRAKDALEKLESGSN